MARLLKPFWEQDTLLIPLSAQAAGAGAGSGAAGRLLLPRYTKAELSRLSSRLVQLARCLEPLFKKFLVFQQEQLQQVLGVAVEGSGLPHDPLTAAKAQEMCHVFCLYWLLRR